MTAPGVVRDCACPRAKHQHGTWNAHRRDGCRCLPCNTAYLTESAQHRHQRSRRLARERWTGETIWTTPVGIQRRLQALCAVGWSEAQLAPRLGVSKAGVNRLRSAPRAKVKQGTAARVAKLYDELWDTAPPRRSLRAIRYAQKQGWAPPLAWDDELIDDPAAEPQGIPSGGFVKATVDEVAVAAALSGRRLRLNHVELDEAIRQATSRGWSTAKVAAVLGTTPRTVQRRRAA